LKKSIELKLRLFFTAKSNLQPEATLSCLTPAPGNIYP